MAQMLNIPSTNTDANYRYKMPRLISKPEGRGNGKVTAVMNCKEVAAALHRQPVWLMKFFGVELGVNSSFDEKEGEGTRAILNGHHMTNDLQLLLDKFISTYVLCPTCGYPEMSLTGNKKSMDITGKCNACGFNGYLANATEHKMSQFAIRSLTEVGGKSGKTKAERQMARAAKA